MQAFADQLGRLFPGQDVELVVDDEGAVSVRVGSDVWRIPDDGLGLVITRYKDNLAHIVRLDDNFNEIFASTVRVGGDPNAN